MRPLARHVAALSSLLILTACGGGDGGGTTTTSPGSTTSGTAPVVTTPTGATFFPTNASIAAYSPVGDYDIDSFGLLNVKRRELGMPAVTRNANVSLAAAAHSSYQVVNLAPGHYEDATKPGFTGVNPQDRVVAKYGRTNYVGEVLVYWTGEYSQTTAPGQLLFDAPFHRLAILTGGTKAGSGIANGSGTPAAHAWTWDLVDYVESMAANQVMVYPYPSQTNVPYSWSNNESPNPLPSRSDLSGATVGYPITVQIRDADTLNVTAFTLTDSGGTVVPCERLDHNNSTETRNNFALCTPYTALKNNQVYVAALSGTINSTPISLSWKFTTALNQLVVNAYDSRYTPAPPTVVPNPEGPVVQRLD